MLPVVTYLDSIDSDRLLTQRMSINRWAEIHDGEIVAEFHDLFIKQQKLYNLPGAISTCRMENAGLLVASTDFLFTNAKFLKQTNQSGVPVYSADIPRLRKSEPELAALFWRICEDISRARAKNLSVTQRAKLLQEARNMNLFKTHAISLGDQIFRSIARSESSEELADRWNAEGRTDLDGNPYTAMRIERMKDALEGTLDGEGRW